MDNNIFKLKNKIIVVTGCNGQLGKAICSFFKKINSIVIGFDLSESESLSHLNEFFRVDIVNREELNQTFYKIIKKYRHIDVLVNNAGVSTFEPFEERTEDNFEWVTNVNLKGTFNCIQSMINNFDNLKKNKCSIINIASMYGIISPDFRIYTDCDRKNSEVYGATKAGIIQMTKYFSTHLADKNIRCNSVSPGGIYNPINPQGEDFIKNYSYRCPMKRMANAEEIVGAIIYLASDLSSYTNGQNITVDGGMSAW